MPGLEPEQPNPASRPQTILLVDDDPHFLAWLCTYLEGEGFTVLKAGHAQEALHKCAKHAGPIHLLLTDLLLPPRALQLQTTRPAWPRMHGLRLMQEIVGLRPEIRAILMSGHSDQELGALQISREGHTFLRKPFSLDTLLWTVNALLGNSQVG